MDNALHFNELDLTEVDEKLKVKPLSPLIPFTPNLLFFFILPSSSTLTYPSSFSLSYLSLSSNFPFRYEFSLRATILKFLGYLHK